MSSNKLFKEKQQQFDLREGPNNVVTGSHHDIREFQETIR